MRLTKRIFAFLLATLLIFTSGLGCDLTSHAKSKKKKKTVVDGRYFFCPADCTKFVVKNKKLYVEVGGDHIQEGIDGEKTRKKMTVKVSKKCKYYKDTFDLKTGEKSSKKLSYKKVAKLITKERANHLRTGTYSTVGKSYFVVRDGKIVKMAYYQM